MQFSAKEAAMTTTKKGKAKRKKILVSKATRRKTVGRIRTIRKKVAKKTPLRPAARKKARPAKTAGKARSIGGPALEAVRPSPSRPATPVSSERNTAGRAVAESPCTGFVRATCWHRSPLLQPSFSCGHAARTWCYTASWRCNPHLGTHNRFHPEGRIP